MFTFLEQVQFKRCSFVCWWRREGLIWSRGKLINWWRDLPRRTGSKRKLCAVPCHSYIRGTWRNKEVWSRGLFGVLPKQATCEITTLQVQIYIQQWFHDTQGANFMYILTFLETSETSLGMYLSLGGLRYL